MHGLLLWSQCVIKPEANQDRIIGQQIGTALPDFQVGSFFVLEMVKNKKAHSEFRRASCCLEYQG
jgi:hypothetical protein